MADQTLLHKIHDLSDLELAALICLVAQEHCIIDTDEDSIDELVQELELIAGRVFGLTHATVDVSEQTALDDFVQALISTDESPTRARNDSLLYTPPFQPSSRSPLSAAFVDGSVDGADAEDGSAIPNVVIVKNLDRAPRQIQIQALELMRSRRVYTRTAMHRAPKRFLFIAALAEDDDADAVTPRLTNHLNEYMFMSHFHDSRDGFANLEDVYYEENDDDGGNSISSVVKKRSSPMQLETLPPPRITAEDIETLSRLSEQTTFAVEVKQYQLNLIAFLRLHRAVSGGITATATKQFDKLAKCLAPLHGLTYITPSLIALAARRIYRHRIELVQAENERSMQWGSDVGAVRAVLKGVGPDEIIEEVVNKSGIEAVV